MKYKFNLFSRIVFMLFFVLACQRQAKEQFISVKKKDDFGIVYYTKSGLTTLTTVSCDDFTDELKYNILYITIKDDIFINEIKNEISTQNTIDSIENINVRYRIEFNNSVLCFVSFGFYTLNGIYKGKFKKFGVIIDFINKNSKESIRLEELPI